MPRNQRGPVEADPPQDTRGRRRREARRRTVPQKTNRPGFARSAGKGEKVGQEPTAPSASAEARKTPSGARPNRGPRSGPLQVPQRGTGPGYRLLRQMILSARLSADRIRLTALPKSSTRVGQAFRFSELARPGSLQRAGQKADAQPHAEGDSPYNDRRYSQRSLIWSAVRWEVLPCWSLGLAKVSRSRNCATEPSWR